MCENQKVNRDWINEANSDGPSICVIRMNKSRERQITWKSGGELVQTNFRIDYLKKNT